MLNTISRMALAAALLLAAAGILFIAKIGPVVMTLTPEHGVHSGDLIALVPLAAAAWLLVPVLQPQP